MSGATSTALLWLFVLNLGLAIGAGLYEHRIVVSRWISFSPEIPTMVGLMGAPDSPESIVAATRWSNLNYLRHGIVLAAWLASLKTFSLLYQRAAIYD
jgi:hypothetical protein